MATPTSMKSIIDKLSENPEGRSLLKWLTFGLGLLAGYQAESGSFAALIPGIAAVLVKWLEQASSNAARAKLEQPNEDPDEYDGEPLTPPDYSKIWPQPEAPTGKLPVEIERKELFQQLGFAPMPAIPAGFPADDEIKLTEDILEANEPITTVLWDDPDEGPKSRKFSRRYDAVVFKRTKPGARIAI